jgi:hypothetical protein
MLYGAWSRDILRQRDQETSEQAVERHRMIDCLFFIDLTQTELHLRTRLASFTITDL